MPQTSNQQQGESTTYHGDAHGDKPSLADTWLRVTVEAAVRCHTLAMLAGGTPRLPVGEWLQARRAADEALATLLEAVQLSAGRLGAHVDERQSAEVSAQYLRADEVLAGLGYRWSPSLQQWLKPAPPSPCAWPEGEAADLLRTLGWEWTGAKWENRKPAPSTLDQPLGVPVVIGRGATNSTKFSSGTPVRQLVELAEELTGKVNRLEYAARCAVTCLAVNRDSAAALQHLRSVV